MLTIILKWCYRAPFKVLISTFSNGADIAKMVLNRTFLLECTVTEGKLVLTIKQSEWHKKYTFIINNDFFFLRWRKKKDSRLQLTSQFFAVDVDKPLVKLFKGIILHPM